MRSRFRWHFLLYLTVMESIATSLLPLWDCWFLIIPVDAKGATSSPA